MKNTDSPQDTRTYSTFPILSTFVRSDCATLATNPSLLRTQLTEVGDALSQTLDDKEKEMVETALGYRLNELAALADLLEGKFARSNVVDSNGNVQTFTQLEAVLLKLGSLSHAAYVAQSGINDENEFRSNLDSLRKITEVDWSLYYPTIQQWQSRKA